MRFKITGKHASDEVLSKRMCETVGDERAPTEKRQETRREKSLTNPSTKHYCAGITANFPPPTGVYYKRRVSSFRRERARWGEFKENRYLPKVSIGFAILSQSAGETARFSPAAAIVRSLEAKEEIEEKRRGKPREKVVRFYGKNPINRLPFEFVLPFDPFPPRLRQEVLLERINSRRKMVRRISPSSLLNFLGRFDSSVIARAQKITFVHTRTLLASLYCKNRAEWLDNSSNLKKRREKCTTKGITIEAHKVLSRLGVSSDKFAI